MAIKTKNAKLKRQVFKKIDKYDSMALKAFKKGDRKKGNKFEKKGDTLYRKNYNKMFEVKK